MTDGAGEDGSITVIDFWADWCGVCRMIEPVVERVVAAHRDVALLKVNVAESADIAEQMGVRGLPTLVFTAADGRELHRLSGSVTGAKIEAALAQARTGL